MINRVLVCGILTHDVISQTTQGGLEYALVKFKIHKYKTNYDFLVGKCWGRMAKFVTAGNYRIGDGVQIIGSLSGKIVNDGIYLDLKIDSMSKNNWIAHAHRTIGCGTTGETPAN